jgi:hypothetical protein
MKAEAGASDAFESCMTSRRVERQSSDRDSGVFLIELPRVADVGIARVRLDALDRRLQTAIDDLASQAPHEATALESMRTALASLGASIREGAVELTDVVVAGYHYAIAVVSRALGEDTRIARWAPTRTVLDELVHAAAFAADEPTRIALHAIDSAIVALDETTSRAA